MAVRTRSWVYDVATRWYGVPLVLTIATALSFADRNFGYFFGLGVVLVVARENGWEWFGFGRRLTVRTVLVGLGLAVLMFVVFAVVDAYLQLRFGEFDLSSVEDIQGNLVGYVILMAVSWVFAAFGEELLFRGYYMKGTAELLGGSTVAWLVAAVLISVYFGVSHAYQGPTGMLSTSLAGLYFALIYFFNRNDLALASLAHGFSNSIGITLIYLGQYDAFNRWVVEHVL